MAQEEPAESEPEATTAQDGTPRGRVGAYVRVPPTAPWWQGAGASQILPEGHQNSCEAKPALCLLFSALSELCPTPVDHIGRVCRKSQPSIFRTKVAGFRVTIPQPYRGYRDGSEIWDSKLGAVMGRGFSLGQG